MLNKFINLKATILAATISIVVTLFLGCFANAPKNMNDSFRGTYWYYINRGYPIAFTGWTLQRTNVIYPHLKLPFIISQTEPKRLEKIIDLTRCAPILLSFFFVAYIPSFLFAKAVDENKKLYPFLIIVDIVFLVSGLFIYFCWFSRV